MKKKLIVLLLASIMFLTSCSGSAVKLSASSGTLEKITYTDVVEKSNAQRLNSFALALYKQLYQEDENIFISPVGIYIALGMAYNGASDQTAQQMAEALSAQGMSMEEFNKSCFTLQSTFVRNDVQNFKMANSIWIRDTFKSNVKKDFLDRNESSFGAEVAALDFNRSNAADAINSWVKKNTNGKIAKAIDGKIAANTMLYLVNAVYFKADWQEQFEAEDTNAASFRTPSQSKTVKMMSHGFFKGYFEDDNMQAVLLPYENGEFSMFVLLPKSDLNALNAVLSESYLSDCLKSMQKSENSVHLELPKVSLQYGTNLKTPLIQMGMTDAFDDDKADFSNLASNAKEQGLYIMGAEHKTNLIIDEKGTEAAGMAKIEFGNKAASEVGAYKMTVDHPFMLGMVDNKSGAILFLGSVTDPQSK